MVGEPCGSSLSPSYSGGAIMAKSTPAASGQAQARQRSRKRRARAQAKVEARQAAEVARVQGLAVVQEHAAGIDIGSRSHWVCAGEGAAEEFPAHTDGLHAIVGHLR